MTRPAAGTRPGLPDGVRAVIVDFSGTLFHVETAAEALLAALGPDHVHHAPALERWGAINGSGTPVDLPDHLLDAWEQRDLSRAAHRAAYSGLSVHAGLTPGQAAAVYERGITPAAWAPYPDTVDVLRRLHEARVPVALLSNIGWEPRPVLAAAGVLELLSTLVLSDERGVQKPDPAVFELACRELATAPAHTVMVGDNAEADGAAVAVGCRFALVSSAVDRPPDTLARAVGLA